MLYPVKMYLIILFITLFSINVRAEKIETGLINIDVLLNQLNYEKPPKGTGKAGTLIFKTANISSKDIVLNINNINNFFDAQIFIRPTFLGFTTRFGNTGFSIEESSIINTVDRADLINTQLIMDEDQLSLAGESMNILNPTSSIKLDGFRLYCQNNLKNSDRKNYQTDVLNNCFSFMTLNGTYRPGNEFAELEYEGVAGEDKTYLKAKVKSFDIRQRELLANFAEANIISNNTYNIHATNVGLNCAKDPDLTSLDFERIKKPCMNNLRLNSLKVSLWDKKEASKFDLDVKNIVVKDKILYLVLNSALLSDPESTTQIVNVLINCRKIEDSDLFELNHVLRDCITYGRASIGDVKSSKNEDKKDSSTKNITINVENGNLLIEADIKFLGFNNRVRIVGRASLDEQRKYLILTITDTKLPFGITSVKLLMHFLKKDLISKDITFNGNVITVAF